MAFRGRLSPIPSIGLALHAGDRLPRDLVAAEHRDGSLFAAVLPYAANPATRELEFGELSADTNEPGVWVD